MCHPYVYKSIPYILALCALVESILGFVRLTIFFSVPSTSTTSNNASSNQNEDVLSPLSLSRQSTAAFILDWIGSMVATLMGIYIIIALLIMICAALITCQTVSDTLSFRRTEGHGCTHAWRCLGTMCLYRPNHRFIALACNCPCYVPRPYLRFRVRLILLCFLILLRVLAVILYASDKKTGSVGSTMSLLCTFSIFLSAIVVALDYYQYRMWCYYRPDGAYEPCRCCCCKQQYHPSHHGFVPRPLLGINRHLDEFGNNPCPYTTTGHCPTLSLQHVVIFHALDYIPQRRYHYGGDLTYIAFHWTSPEAAVSIARTGFRISRTPPQMLGFGVYFARSSAACRRKARRGGMFRLIESRLLLIHLRYVRYLFRCFDLCSNSIR